jgi:hypothetical protein
LIYQSQSIRELENLTSNFVFKDKERKTNDAGLFFKKGWHFRQTDFSHYSRNM